jgi:tryptophan 2-monooxygenase
MSLIPNLRTWDRVNDVGLPKLVLKKPLSLPRDAEVPMEYAAPSDLLSLTTLRSQDIKPQAYIDHPQVIYSAWPKAVGGIDKPLGKFDKPTKICLIGGGISNLVAALELAKAGADVTLLESTDKVGGRCLSEPTADGKNRAEMGAMRFPPSEDLLYYYAAELGFTFIPDFPDPGVYPTIVTYQGQAQIWTGGRTLVGFETVHDGWLALVKDGVKKNGVTMLESIETMQNHLVSTDINERKKVIPLWQKWLDTFSGKSFFEGLQLIFGKHPIGDIPGGKQWTDDDFGRFGALGVGSGGFGPLYAIAFSSVWRIICNGLETNQQIFAKVNPSGDPEPAGIQDLAEALLARAQKAGLKFHANTTGIPIAADSTSVTVEETSSDGKYIIENIYDFVIVGTTTRAMNVNMSISAAPYFRPFVCTAIDNVHMTSSSKLFIRTKKFWANDPAYPRVILSDTKLPQLYTLDYGHPDYGMVLVTYTWEDLSDQIASYSDPKKLFAMLLKQVKTVLISLDGPYKDFANNLVPVTDSDYWMIHWQNDPLANGAFVLGQSGQDELTASLFYDYTKIGSGGFNAPAPILMNGDSVGFSGGWIDGGLQCAMNAVSAIINAKGSLNHPELAPATLLDPNTYNYQLKY